MTARIPPPPPSKPPMTAMPPAASAQSGREPIAMSLHFDDTDPVATCLVDGCRWHGHGDSMSDAAQAWTGHVARDHRNDWDD